MCNIFSLSHIHTSTSFLPLLLPTLDILLSDDIVPIQIRYLKFGVRCCLKLVVLDGSHCPLFSRQIILKHKTFDTDKIYNTLNARNMSYIYFIFNTSDLLWYVMAAACQLPRWGLGTHACVIEVGHPWFRQSLLMCSAPAYYQNQYWLFSVSNILQRNLNQTKHIFSDENLFEDVVCHMSVVLFRPKSGIILPWSNKLN